MMPYFHCFILEHFSALEKMLTLRFRIKILLMHYWRVAGDGKRQTYCPSLECTVVVQSSGWIAIRCMLHTPSYGSEQYPWTSLSTFSIAWRLQIRFPLHLRAYSHHKSLPTCHFRLHTVSSSFHKSKGVSLFRDHVSRSIGSSRWVTIKHTYL